MNDLSNVAELSPAETGFKIRTCREEAGYTRRRLAEELGVSESTLASWEMGSVKKMKLKHLNHIAEILGVKGPEVVSVNMPETDMPGEDKDRICKLLTPVLRELRAYPDLDYLTYKRDKNKETVTVVVTDPSGVCPSNVIEVDVTADSGLAMIKDILRALG